jgi:hypothetical protein
MVICSDAASPRTMLKLMKSRLDLIILSLADPEDEDRFSAQHNARLYDAWVITVNGYGYEDSLFWNGHLVVSDPLGKRRATGQNQEQYLVYELRFTAPQGWLKRGVRKTWVRVPLIFHLLRNWKEIGRYY